MILVTRFPIVLCLTAGVFFSCSRKSQNNPSPQAEEATAIAQEVNYYRDIKPLIETKCVNCHQTGGLAPFALTDATTVVRMQNSIVTSTQSKVMPPWLAADGCQNYQNDRSLTAEEINLIALWQRTGAKLGNPGEFVDPGKKDPGLTRVDREMVPIEAYKPKAKANDYRCFVMDWPETSTKYVTGVGVIPGHPDLVHHVIAYRVPAQQIETVKAMDEAEEGPGYTCFGGPLGGSGNLPQLAQWAPGSLGRDLPNKTGLKIEPGSKIVMQVHYNTEHAEAVPDQSKLLLKLDDAVEKDAYILPFTDPSWVRNHTMNIPAGQADVVHRFSAPLSYYATAATGGLVPSGSTLKIYSSALHMHLLGQKTSLSLERKEGGRSCLLDIPQWDFHWQGSYVFKEVLTAAPGDLVKLECHFNNSGAAAKDVNWGEGTEDEMCLGFLYVTL